MHCLQEALGLGIFMISACFFGAMLFSKKSSWYQLIQNNTIRNVLMGLAMGITALFIFYQPFIAPSGSQINPAVAITFLRTGQMCRYDALFFILFQIIGGLLAVFLMQLVMRSLLIAQPIHLVVTVPGKYLNTVAAITEFAIDLITISMVLLTSHNKKHKKCQIIFAG